MLLYYKTFMSDLPKAFGRHDHAVCTQTALSNAAASCEERGLRFTTVRRRALEILLESHRAIGAYDLLARLSEDGLGSQPPVAYRALDFLVSNGFAHKIERLNAFVACVEPGSHDGASETASPAAFLICTDCGAVGETLVADFRETVDATAGRAGFVVADAKVEVEGTCPDCQEGAS